MKTGFSDLVLIRMNFQCWYETTAILVHTPEFAIAHIHKAFFFLHKNTLSI